MVKQDPTTSHVAVFRTSILDVKLSPLRVNFTVITDLPRRGSLHDLGTIISLERWAQNLSRRYSISKGL